MKYKNLEEMFWDGNWKEINNILSLIKGQKVTIHTSFVDSSYKNFICDYIVINEEELDNFGCTEKEFNNFVYSINEKELLESTIEAQPTMNKKRNKI